MTRDDALGRLAAAHGVMTSYEDWAHSPVDVPARTVVRTLRALGVDATSDAAVSAALAAVEARPWRELLPPSVVVSPRRRTAPVHARVGADVRVVIECEDGSTRKVPDVGPVEDTRAVDGCQFARRTMRFPADVPVGYHRLVATADDRKVDAALIVAPATCPTRAEIGRAWGWMVQLYAVRSHQSWGLGDYADLAELGRWSGGTGADFLLCNPLHAAAPTLPQVDSPYSPVSRRFHSTLHLRVDAIPEAAQLDGAARARLDRLAAAGRSLNTADRLDRDSTVRLQREALELVREVPLSERRRAELAAYRTREGDALLDFATWCALSERHGPDWRTWPEPLRHPRSPAVATARQELADLVELHVWLQWLCEDQLAAAQAAARSGGQRIGVIHDLAVGVGPSGADAWAMQDELALEVSVGAPPDSFNQRGQDWALPPLRPDRLAATGYAPFRDMLRSVLQHAGGIRIDHAMGLFRLYWIAEGCSPADGTYVRYPAEDLLGVLAVEATRADAVVVAEDLGTVEDGVPEALAEWGVHGSAVLWFEREENGPFRPAADYRPDVLASVTTHDLPTAAGFWRGEATRVRAELDQLGEGRSVADQEADDEKERADLRALLEAEGLVAPGADEGALVEAMHRLLARSPARLLGVGLADAVGEVRQPNLPGTQDEYPNWRLPLAVTLEGLPGHPGVRRMIDLLRADRPRAGG